MAIAPAQRAHSRFHELRAAVADQIPTQRVASRLHGLRAAVVSPSGAVTPARHRAEVHPSYGVTKAAAARRSNAARHSQPRRRPETARTTTGAHRAPSENKPSLPVEEWLQVAKNRPQVLLGTLVAAGLLLTAVPFPQGGGSTSVMTAAAEAVGVISRSEPQQRPEREVAEPESVQAQPAVTTSAEPAPPGATPTARQTESRPEQPTVPVGDGPFNSLRTTGSQVVMLSFDDGPDPVQTPKILDMLETYQVKAVFCLVGTQVESHPELVRRIVDDGHVLCNHTWDHDLKIGTKKAAKIRADLDRTNAAIRAIVPDADIPYFRAPGGNFSDRLVKTAYGDGMTSLYWEVDPRDWEHLDGETDATHVKRIVAQVKKQTIPGAIVLSHDFNQPTTITAYEQLLPWLVENFQVGIPGQATAPTPSEPAPAPEPSEAPAEAPVVTPSASATV